MRNDQPFVGKSAFAHKGGMHVSAVMKEAATYEHVKPELIGDEPQDGLGFREQAGHHEVAHNQSATSHAVLVEHEVADLAVHLTQAVAGDPRDSRAWRGSAARARSTRA